MKKQNIVKKITIVASLIAVSLLSSLAIMPTGTAQAATCYGNNSAFKGVCIAPDSILEYFDAFGGRLTTLDDASCFLGTHTVNTSIYRQGDCAALETARLKTQEDLCTASGGVATREGSATNATISCACPAGQTYTNNMCAQVPQTPSGDTGMTERVPEDCKDQNLTSDNCGIIRYANIALNFVSGGVTLAVIGNIIFAGIQYSTAQGDPSAVGKAKKRIRDAIIAFLMFLSLYGFVQWLIPGGVFA